MFTGIVHAVGVVQQVAKAPLARCLVMASNELESLQVGESMAVNGVCLTVASTSGHSFSTDLLEETARMTTLGSLVAGDAVNLERAIRPMDRMGGHFVTGHVDGIGIVQEMIKRDGGADAAEIAMTLRIPGNLLKYIIWKGSLSVDGVSLTIQQMTEDGVVVFLIPHTRKVTTLGTKKKGDGVNIEADLIGKYVERLCGNGVSGYIRK